MQIGALMLESLLELALAKKEEIRNKLEDFYASGPDTDKYWVNYSFKENKQETTISAGDGSINKKKFLSFVFYAISAETLIYDTKLEKIESSQMDIMPHHRFVEDRLRNYMSIYELKSALKSLKLHNPDYYLFDGSILGNLIRPIPLDRELDNNLKDKIKSLYMDRLKNELDSGDVEIFYAVDGYSTSFPIEYLIDNKILMAYQMNNVTMPPERGFPFQLVAESKWGYKWVKWITKIEVSNNTDYEGYWESRGYSNSGNLNESFIK
jgi:hypothetical protein